MTCVGPRNYNQFNLLDSLNLPPPNELNQVLPQGNSFKKGTFRDSTLVASKLQRNADQHCDLQRPYNVPRQSGNNKPRFTEVRASLLSLQSAHSYHRLQTPGRNNVIHRVNQPNCYSPTVLPRFQNKPMMSKEPPRGFCNPTPRPCPEIIAPCLLVTPVCSEKELLNAQLMQQVLAPLQRQPSTTCPVIPKTMPQHTCTPISSPPVSIQVQPNPHQPKEDQNNVRTAGRGQSPHAPEIVSRTPTNASDLVVDPPEKLNVNLPPPPGLSKPSGRGPRYNNRPRASTKPIKVGRRPNQAVEDSSFERYNGPVATSRVFSPPPSGAAPGIVKLPAGKDTQPIPRSPATTASSLSEDLSGGSSVLCSDTTFTSVESNVSNKVPQNHRMFRPVCRNWMKGRPCFFDPCSYLHPARRNQLANGETRPTQSLSARPPPSGVVKTSVHAPDQNNNLIPRKHDPPNGNAEPPQRPEPLYATTISDHIKVRFDQGFEVREVVTGFESRWVHLGNIAGTVTSAALNELLVPYKVDNIHLPESSLGKPVTVKVQFASAADALRAVADLNGIEFAKRTIVAKVAINNSTSGSTVLTDTDVQLIWECPFRVGYAGYDTLKEAKAAIDSLNGFPMEYLVVSAQLYEGLPCVGAYNVIFKQLPASGDWNYESLDKAVNSIRSRLEEYGTVTSFDIIPSPYKDGLVKAWARFTSPTEARAAQD
ncbi:hypothetical protein J3R83DRAFT_10610 [Lanmaoa asiatica]|nr:hypothetical protein J3R83DRAFT_10610 [Lanmaoa asiatica]